MTIQQKRHSRTFSILFISTFLLASLSPIIYTVGKPNNTNKRGNNGRNVKPPELDLYSDEACTTSIQKIDWGEITPGGNATAILYVKNRSKTPLTLSCDLSNFSPMESTNYLALDWNRENYILEAHKTIQAKLVLSVSETDASDAFNVDVLISGTA
jgi:hypothetical protein